MSAAADRGVSPQVRPDVVTAVFHTAAVSTRAALLVAELDGTAHRLSWANEGALHLVGYALDDLRRLTVDRLLPTLAGGELRLLLRRERGVRMTLPVQTASGSLVEAVVTATPSPSGRMWTLALLASPSEDAAALRATADAHERRFAALTERSPVPTFLSEQGMRLAHVNDAFCALVDRPAEQLLGTGWMAVLHPDDVDRVVEQTAAVLEGAECESRARLLRPDGTELRTVLRLAHLFTPGVGAGFVGTIEDITERLAFEAQLAHQANHDPLTGLPNRTLLDDYVTRRFTRGDSGLACLFLDLDDFKVVNDSLGHAAGDQLLVAVADRLRDVVRPTDLVARFGGDEFVVVCEHVDEAGAVGLAERIAAALDRPLVLGGVELRPHASIGVTVQTSDHATSDDLVRDCDIAMYQAKAQGRGRISVVDRRARAAARDKLRLVTELREAIAFRDISLAYQPIFDTGAGRPVAVEALARWEHPTRGPVNPATFVPLAEETGLIGALGLLVLDEA